VSLSALLTAVQNHLRTQLSLSPDECGVQPDGQPPPFLGKRYIAIHATGWSPGDIQDYGPVLDEVLSLAVTITVRAPKSPRDRITTNIYLKEATGIEAIARSIMLALHSNVTVLSLANAELEDTEYGYTNTLLWQGTDANPRLVGPDWVWSDNPQASPVAALVTTVQFGMARRIQDITIAT